MTIINDFERLARATVGLTALAFGALPGAARAQDRVNLTITAPTLGSFPQLAAGSFDIINQNLLTSHPAGNGQQVVMGGLTEPVRVQMMLPWGGEVAQLLKGMVSGTLPSAIDNIRCDFVHAGSTQPYYTVVIDHPVVTHIDLAYDSAAATATEQMSLDAPQVEFLDASAAPSTPTTTASRMTARRPAVQPLLRLAMTPAALRRLVTTNGATAGPPVAGFASFATGSGAPSHFAPEATFPAWATGAMANLETLSLSFDMPSIIHRQTLADGTVVSVPATGTMAFTKAQFTKGVGSLSNDLQAAVSALQRVNTTFELADAPGRLAYSIQFLNGFISSDHTSLNNGHAVEQVTVTSVGNVTVTDLRHNVTAHVH